MKGAIVNCENVDCNKEFVKNYHNSRFCGRSCSNVTIKRKGYVTKICKCTYCSNDCEHFSHKFCKGCKAEGRHLMRASGGKLLNEITIQEYCPRRGANAYDNIRSNARRSVESELKNGCEECGWSHHVEVCHIKSISSFSKDTVVSVVNKRSNLKLLCPNCHWVFDH